jgi:hypothetical protein
MGNSLSRNERCAIRKLRPGPRRARTPWTCDSCRRSRIRGRGGILARACAVADRPGSPGLPCSSRGPSVSQESACARRWSSMGIPPLARPCPREARGGCEPFASAHLGRPGVSTPLPGLPEHTRPRPQERPSRAISHRVRQRSNATPQTATAALQLVARAYGRPARHPQAMQILVRPASRTEREQMRDDQDRRARNRLAELERARERRVRRARARATR